MLFSITDISIAAVADVSAGAPGMLLEVVLSCLGGQ